MAIPQINNTDIPIGMRNRGTAYNFDPGDFSTPNGYGKIDRAGPQSLIWTFNRMSLEDIQWWEAFLGGEPSVTLTQARLWDHRQVMREFTSGELYEPVMRGRYRAGQYWEMQIEIQQILPYYTSATIVP